MFNKNKNKEQKISPEKMISKNLDLYQEVQSNDDIKFESDDFKENYHDVDPIVELNEFEDSEKQLEDIKIKCKFKKEYAEDKVILSVNHLKQYFFFGSGPGRYKLKAVHDVNFQIKEGECFGLVGESGCGKTTTGRSIIRLYNITSGSIYYKGYRIGAGSRWNEKEIKYTNIRFNKKVKELKARLAKHEITKEEYDSLYKEALNYKRDICKVQRAKISQIKKDDKKASELGVNDEEIAKYKAELKIAKSQNNTDRIEELKGKIATLKATNHKLMSEIQMIFQDPVDSLDPRMTVESIISEGLQIQGFRNKAENHAKVVEALEKVGLIEDYANRYPHEFSGGQRQRIGIARALVMNPKLLICDEPISALDVSIRAQIINLLNELKDEMGLSILFIAHDLSVVKYFCDRIAVMYFGEIVELATSDELFRHPLHPYTKSLLSAIPKPNPYSERKRKRILYNPQECHDYSVNKPKFVEIEPGHFILANEQEVLKYKEEIAKIDKEVEEGKSTLEILDETLAREEALHQHEEDLEETFTQEDKEESSNEEVIETTEQSEEVVEEVLAEEVNESSNDEELVTEEAPQEDLSLNEETGKKVYLLSKVNDKWQVELKDGSKAIKTFTTKEEAFKYAKALCKSQNGELYVKATKGKNAGEFIKA